MTIAKSRTTITLVVALSTVLVAKCSAYAQSERSKTSTFAKIDAVATKPDADGQQILTVTIEIDGAYLLIGNKVPEDLESQRFTISLKSNGMPIDAKIAYPTGLVEKDKIIGDY